MKDKPKPLDLSQFDPILLESIERSLEPYKGLLSSSLIEALRQEALIHAATDPYAQALVGKLRARRPIQESGPNPIEEDVLEKVGVAEPAPSVSNGAAHGVARPAWRNGSGGPR